MKIMVCDEKREDRETLAGELQKIWPQAEVGQAASGEELICGLRSGKHWELIFLDIYMDGMDGVETGQWIHEKFPQCAMVFVSESRDFGPELFAVDALHYLIKPVRPEDLEEVRRRLEARQSAVFQLKGREEIPFQMITYIESVHNNLEIHLLSGKVEVVRDSLQNFLEKLDDRFLRINRGIVVNMDAVEKMDRDSCQICGLTFMLSRRTRQESRKRYHEFLFETAMKI